MPQAFIKEFHSLTEEQWLLPFVDSCFRVHQAKDIGAALLVECEFAKLRYVA